MLLRGVPGAMRHAPPSYGPFAGKGRAPAALKGAALRAASLHPRLFIPPGLICLSVRLLRTLPCVLIPVSSIPPP